MLNFRKKIFLFLTIIGLVALLASCSDNTNSVRINIPEDEYEVRMHADMKVEPVVRTSSSMSIDDVELVYESSDESVVKYVNGWLYPQAEGEATIKVYWKEKNVVFDKATVKVIKAALPQLVYTQNVFFKNEVGEIEYTLDYNYTDAVASFESLNPEIAEITPSGTVTAHAVGEAQIKVKVNDASEEYEEVVKLTVVESDFAIKAYELNGGQIEGEAPTAYNSLEELVLPVPVKAGYTFEGWSDGVQVLTKIAKGTTGDIESLRALWKAVVYGITYDYAGGAEVADAPASFTVEDEVALPTPSRDGYEFAGWTVNGEAIEKIEVGTVGDVVLVATWTPVTYAITYDYAGGSEVADAPVSFTVEDEVVLPTPSREHYEFAGWAVNGEVIEKIAVGTVGDVALVATWTAVEYAITFDYAGGDEVADAPKSYTVEDEVVLPTPTRAGYKFLGWVENDVVVEKIEKGSTGARSFVATWEIAEQAVNYELAGGVAPAGSYVFDEANAVKEFKITQYLQATSNTGYEVSLQTTNKLTWWGHIALRATSNPELFEIVQIANKSTGITVAFDYVVQWHSACTDSASKTVLNAILNSSAEYVGDYVVIKNMPAEKGVADMTVKVLDAANVEFKEALPSKYVPGTAVALDAAPTREGYEFAGWDLNGKIVNEIPADATGDLVLTATWKAIEYTISFDTDGGSIPGKYATREEAVADYLNDYNTARNKSHTVESYIALGSWGEISDASLFLYNETYRAKWAWLVDHIASVASAANKHAWTVFNNFSSQKELNADNSNNIYCIAYELRGWVGAIQYTKNGNFKTADYSVEEIKNGWQSYAGLCANYTVEDEVALPVPTKENHNFLGWTLNGEVVETIPVGTMGDMVLVATWESIIVVESAINYELAEGVLPEGAPTTYVEGTGLATLPVPTKEGYEFLGWYVGEEKVTAISAEQTGEVTLTAKWEQIIMSAISYELAEGVLPEGAPTSYREGVGLAKLPTPTKEGFVFDGWYVGEEKVTAISAEQTGDVVLTAKWAEYNEYSISYELSEGSWSKVTVTKYDTYDAVVDAVLADFGLTKGFSIWVSNVDDKFIANLDKWGFLLDYFLAVRNDDGFNKVITDTKAGNDQTGSVNPYVLTGELKAFANKNENSYVSAGITSADYSKEEVQAKLFEFAPESYTKVEDIEYPTTYVEGEGVELAVPYRAGYDFAGWYNAEGQLVTEVTAEMSGDLVLTAKWRTASGEEGVVFVGADREYKTLADALAVILPGETIKVDAGTYEGAEIKVAGVTVAGPNAGVNPNTAERADEAVFTSDVVISADDVTIDGIQITGAARVKGGAAGCDNVTVKNVWSYQSTTNNGNINNTAPFYFASTTAGVEYSNLVFENLKMSDRTDVRPMAMYFGRVNNVSIKNSSFVAKRSSYNDAIKFGADSTYVKGEIEVVGCHFEKFAQYVLWFMSYGEGNYVIENNTFVENGQTAGSHCAVRFNAYVGAEDGVSSIKFNYNTVDNSYMLARFDKVSNRTADTQPVVVNYNKLLNCADTYYVKNSNGYNIDASNNYYDKAPTASVMMNCVWEPYYTNIDDVPQYGQPLTVFPIEYVLNGGTMDANAPQKYDGSVGLATLPVITKAGYIFEGWVMNGAIVTALPVGTSGKVTLTAQFREDALYVSKNGESYAYATIAEALAAAKEGDKIIILAGEWEENVTVSVAGLTIAGPNQGVSAVNGTRVAEAVIKGIISVDASATDLTIDGLAFTAGGKVMATATNANYDGFDFINNYVYDTNASTTAWQEGRYVVNAVVEFKLKSGGQVANVQIYNNKFENNDAVNLLINRAHNLSVDGNIFKDFGQDAIRIEGGYATGVLAFTNNVFEQTTPESAHMGIYLYTLSGPAAEAEVVIEGNTFKQLGMNDTTSLYHGAIGARTYQEYSASYSIKNNIFDHCYDYMHLRNNGATASIWSCVVENNQFLGLPANQYIGSYNGTSDTATTNPHLAVFGANYYEDNDGNVIADLAQYEAYFKHIATYGTALAEKPVAADVEKYEFWTISYDLAGGTAKGLVTSYNRGTGAIVLPTPEWNVYHEFAGWTLNDEIVTEIPAGSKGNLHLVATWTEVEGDPITLEFELNGGNWSYGSFKDISLDLLADYNAYGGTNYTQETLPTGAWVNINIHNFFYSEGMKEKWSWLATWLGQVGGSSNRPGCAALPQYDDAKTFASKNSNYIYEVSYEFRAIMRGSSITSNSNYLTPDYSEPTLNQQIWAPLNAVQATTIDTTVGKEMTLPTAHKVFLSFVGWFDNPEFTGEPITNIVVVENNPKYYAKFIDLNPVTSVNILNPVTSMKRYESYQLTWEVIPAAAANKEVKFESSDSTVVSVDTDGKLVANKNGEATIKVISTANEEIFGQVTINVYSPAHIEGSYATNSYVSVGQDIQINAEVVDGEGSIVWSTSDETIATVVDGVVTGVAEGLVEITATLSNDENNKVVFIVTVLDGELSDVAQFVLDQHYSNVYTSYGLGIGSGTPAYYSDIYGSVSTILFNHPLVIDTQYLEAGNKTGDYYANANTVYGGIQFVTFHYTAGMGATADTDNHASYFTGGSADVSIHYVTGNHGLKDGAETAEIFQTLDHKHGAWHAGDSNSRYYSNSNTYDEEGMKRFEWKPTGVAYDGCDLLDVEWSASDDFYFEINGKKTSIALPGTYNYKERNTNHIYNADGTISSRDDFTFSWAKFSGRTPESFFNDQGFAVKVVDGEYYMGPTWWSYGQVVEGRICSVGGNLNSIGIESCVNEGSDLWLTWQITAKLIAKLLYDNNLGAERVKGHHFFDGKDCPQPLLENDLAIWNETIKGVQAELALLTTYAGYEFAMVSNNPELITTDGRITDAPEYATTATYTVTISKDGQVIDTLTLASYIPGIYEK